MRRFAAGVTAAAALTALALGAPLLWAVAEAGAGYKAKILCSSVFVSGREPARVLAEDLSADGYQMLALLGYDIDRADRSASASLLGLAAQRAVYRPALGCTLSHGRPLDRAAAPPAPPASPVSPWPVAAAGQSGEGVDGVDRDALRAAVATAFAEPDPARLRRTRALVVVHRGRIAAERYAEGFDAAMPLLGWSMTKSTFALVVGALAQRGLVAVGDDELMARWRKPGDGRAAITLDELLRGSSGLAFGEDYDDELSDVVTMLFTAPDAASFAAAKPLLHPPGTRWRYSSGSVNIAAGALRERLEGRIDYARLPRELLFEPLGMESAVMETDASGGFVASSFMYASARDWARLGQLLLDDGVWRGKRILPQGWRDYLLRPTPGAPDGRYGAAVWLKLPDSAGLGEPPMPPDAYYMLGHEQQIVAVIPSRQLVIVRLGLSRLEGAWDHARDLAPIVAAFAPQAR